MFELYENQFQKNKHRSNYFKLRKISDKNWTSMIKKSITNHQSLCDVSTIWAIFPLLIELERNSRYLAIIAHGCANSLTMDHFQ